MKKNLNIVGIIYILLVYLSVATDRQGIYNVQYMSKYYIGIIICIFLFILLVLKDGNKIIINKKQLYIAKIMFIPILVAFFYSIIINGFNNIEYSGFYSRSFGLVAYCLLAIIQAYLVYSYFGKKAVKYTFIALVLSYFTSIIVAFKNEGVLEFINILTNNSYHGSVLEMHELAPTIALILFYLLYLAYMKKINSKKAAIYIGICLVIIILSMIRIVFLTCGIVVILFLILKRKNKNRLRYVTFFSIVLILISYIYIYCIKVGILYGFLDKYNINSMARTELWSGISSQYDFSLMYMGHGLGFVSIWMDNNWRYLNINGLTQTTGLHNDILKFYIDLGFVGNLVYMINLLYFNTKRIFKKINRNSAMLYFVLIVLQILMWFTDVVSIYHNFQWIFYLIVFSLLSLEND